MFTNCLLYAGPCFKCFLGINVFVIYSNQRADEDTEMSVEWKSWNSV